MTAETVGEHVHVDGDPPCPGCGWHVAPRLVHSGTYALYETPDGGRHLAYRPKVARSEDGELVQIAVAEDQHLPDIPPQALPLIDSFLTNGLPPAVLAMLSGKLSPVAVMKALKNGLADGAG